MKENWKFPWKAGLLLGLAIGYIVVSRLYHPRQISLVNWEQARSIALRIASRHPLPAPQAQKGKGYYEQLLVQVRSLLASYTGTEVKADLESFEVIDREKWIDYNLSNFQEFVGSFERKINQLVCEENIRSLSLLNLTRGLMSTQLGVLMGYMAGRVLGQYDLLLLGREPITSGKLYLVEPNISLWQQRLGLPTDEFRLWVTIHEVGHAWQFENHPWLRDYMNEQINTHLEAGLEELTNISWRRSARTLRQILRNLSRGMRLVEVVMTPQQRESFQRLQALMSLIEGYSNHLMQELAKDLIPHHRLIKERFEGRARKRGFVERLFVRLTGLDLKREQYVLGEKFVNQVVRKKGLTFLNQVWEGPEKLPTLEEIRYPRRWIKRMSGNNVTLSPSLSLS